MPHWYWQFTYDHPYLIIWTSVTTMVFSVEWALILLYRIFKEMANRWEPDVCDQCGEKTLSIIYHKYIGKRCQGRPKSLKIAAQAFRPGERKW